MHEIKTDERGRILLIVKYRDLSVKDLVEDREGDPI